MLVGGNGRHWSEINKSYPQLVATPQQGQINSSHVYYCSNKYSIQFYTSMYMYSSITL